MVLQNMNVERKENLIAALYDDHFSDNFRWFIN